MADSAFVLADIDKLVQFEKKSEEAIKEFDAIKEKFNDINTTLLKKWKGEGKDAYKKESDHIMENSFWIGVYPGMTDAKLDYMAKVLCEAVRG